MLFDIYIYIYEHLKCIFFGSTSVSMYLKVSRFKFPITLKCFDV